MAIKPTYIPDGKPLRLDKIGVALPRPRYQRCLSCDALYLLPTVKCTQNAWCPRCHAKVHNGMDWSLTRLAAMALTMLLLMPFAWSEPLLRIWLLGAHSDASLLQGVWQMAHQGDVITAAMVLFCSVAAPVILVVAIGYLWLGNILNMNLRPILLMLDRLKEWVMLDIYLVGIMVASIKVQDYAWIQPGTGLFAFVSLTILSVMTVIHLNTEELWQRFYPQPAARYNTDKLCVCIGCEYTGLPDARGRCQRCHSPLRARKKNSLQKTWAALICAIIFLVPANLLPISVVYVNGARQEDTIISGVLSLAQDNIAVAGVVFVASILVPFLKVIVLLTLLLSIHFRCQRGLKSRILLLRFITWVGRWSMLDLFVISLTMSLINRDQLLAFTMGPAAFWFGSAVIFTILAVQWLDSRLLWDAHESANARFTD